MRRIFCILLAFALTLPLAACAAGGAGSSAAAAVSASAGSAAASGSASSSQTEEAAFDPDSVNWVDWTGKVEHLFFHPVVAYPELAFDGDNMSNGIDDWMVTADEYKKILQSVYDKGFVLVDINQVWEESKDASGNPVMGTALTTEQMRLLSRYTKELILCYDNDNAGKIATERALGLLNNSEFTVRVLQLPRRLENGEYVKQDADDFIKFQGAPAFERLLSGSENGIEFRMEKRNPSASASPSPAPRTAPARR